MVVYWEYAFAENCLLDGLLLYLALKFARGNIRWLNLLFAAAAGGAEGVLFPLITLPDWCVFCIKILGGLLLVMIAVSKGTRKTYFIAIASFYFLTFSLGGLLTAVYSYFQIPYLQGQGYYIESAPVALVLAGAGIFTIACSKGIGWLFRYRGIRQRIFSCHLKGEKKEVCWKAFADSGNCLFFHGAPVCVISPVAVFALFGPHPQEVGRMTVGSVHGSRQSPVFVCSEMKIDLNGETRTFENVFFTTGELHSKEYQIILHTAFLEGLHEATHRVEGVAAKDEGK